MKSILKYTALAAITGLGLSACQKETGVSPQAAPAQSSAADLKAANPTKSGTAQRSGEYLLRAGQTLTTDQYLQSAAGNYRLTMQGDGNLVLTTYPAYQAVWSTGTHSPGARCSMQSDGNLVVYSTTGVPVYSTGAIGGAGSARVAALVLDNTSALFIIYFLGGVPNKYLH